MRTKGKITSWNDEKGFGFVTPVAGGKRVFVHINAFNNRNRRPGMNLLVTYALSTDRHGRPCATSATLVGDRLPQKASWKNASLSVISACVFLITVGISVVFAKIPPFILALYLAASLLTLIIYAVDKSAAKKGAWRIQESTLHLLSLVGGWPGALVAQQKLRHKTRKKSFRSVFWITVILNCCTFAWMLTRGGAASLQSLIASVV